MGRSLRALRPGESATVMVPDPDLVPEEDLSAAIVQYAALLARAAARMLGRRSRPPDRLLDVEEAATRLRTTPDWLSRQKALPFRVELSPGQVRYSEQGLDEWIATKRGGVDE
jgi:predicted DNA-binding transcriptional regulator AlpA